MNWVRRLYTEAPVTSALIVVNLIVYATMVISEHVIHSPITPFASETLIDAGAAIFQPNRDVTHWRWLTAAFIHVELVHLLMNLWVLAQIGILSERAIGRGLFAASYVVTGVSGNALAMLLASWRGRVGISAGASGAIMGLIGLATAFAWLTKQRRIARVLAWNILLVLGVGFSLTAGNLVAVDNAAHVGGLVVGVLIGAVRARVSRPAPRWLDGLFIGGSAALTALAFGVVHAYGGTR
jgi:rhomboid protease GluP